jgi:hypothetical protein
MMSTYPVFTGWSEPISPMITPHGLSRIRERMALKEVEILKMLESGVYGIVSQIYPNKEFSIKHQLVVVIFDKKKRMPFLFILQKELFGWELITAYQTYEFHRRKYSVVVKPSTIEFARYAQRAFEKFNAMKRRELEHEEKSKNMLYVVNIVIITKNEHGKLVRFSKILGTVPKEEYEVYPSLEIFLKFFITKNLLKLRIFPFSNVLLVVQEDVNNGKEISSIILQEELW